MLNRWQKLAVVVGCTAVVLILLSFLEPGYGPICADGQNAEKEHCPTYNVVYVAFWHLGGWLNGASPAVAALATIAIGAFTLTLWLTSRAQAQLTVVAIEDARLASQRELRAYIEALPLKMALVGGGQEIIASIVITNRGKTPAFDVRSTADFYVWPIPLDQPFRFNGSLADSPQPLPTYVVYPDGVHLSAPRYKPSDADVEKMKKGDGLYVIGLVTYLDAFNERQWAEVCSYLDYAAYVDWRNRAHHAHGEMVAAAFKFSHLSNRASRS